jgi:carnitine 3-dehydrogenase
MKEIRRVALIGAGVIGSGWAARLLAHGYDVVASDPGPDAEAKMRAAVDNAWPALQKVGLKSGADKGRLRFVAEVEAVIIASSSSGLLPSRIQADCKHPERIVIGHPFNPVYLLPLVEVLGGEKTSPEAIDRAAAFYRSIGMYALKVRAEIPGYISDRLQEALWREALHMVAEGVATTAEIDDAVRFGPGLRWSFFGTCLIFHMAGGDEGMKHMLAQFGPALQLPWTKLKAPELSDELFQRMVEGTGAQARGRSVKELERFRDDCLIAVQEAIAAVKKKHGLPADF